MNSYRTILLCALIIMALGLMLLLAAGTEEAMKWLSGFAVGFGAATIFVFVIDRLQY